MENAFAPISEACVKALSDKTYEKRRVAASEIEKMVADFNSKKNVAQIKRIIEVLSRDFVTSNDSNKKKGGLIALAATSIALGKDTEMFIDEIVNPALNCLMDTDTRVRYFASESIYNVVKVSRGSIIPMFPSLFTSLSRLVTDPDQNVKTGSELLDRLLKDIVIESASCFDLDAFMPLVRERIMAKNSFARQFIISWISVLNAVPEINMVPYLPEILLGLFQMLEDNMPEIQRMCESLLTQFLKAIKSDPGTADIPQMMNVLIVQAQSSNLLIQFTAIIWIKEFVQLAGGEIIGFSSGLFTAILPCLAFEGESKRHIKECATAVNDHLLVLVSARNDRQKNLQYLDLDSVMQVLRQYLIHSSVPTKIATLRWVHHLFTEVHDEMSTHANNLFPLLLRDCLSDSSDEVVLQTIVVLAEIVNSATAKGSNFDQMQYKHFLMELLTMFSENTIFLENRGTLIIRQLCRLLNAEYIYRTFAEILQDETPNLKFASTMVRTLNLILLTTSDLFDLRNTLRDIKNEKSASLFECLYKCWSHCAVSTLSLCLLAQCYQQVSEIVILFADMEITVDFLVEIDKLVQLIESPIFASLRLTLISHANDNADAQHLSRALYGILMLLPQTEAFNLLRNRLQCVPNYWGQPTKVTAKSSNESQSKINFDQLFVHFKRVQDLHHRQRLEHRRKNQV
ncbi:protein VAC14 homolog [Toxorhynchites rutilus septentrionalis]|uniref:protein VAC14 homolog n=1 Tax=Toxorhynchites rutilus septentrionalis TaxID=329112 RepID=UPI00247A90A1|nr:protein VAC14 homolog [Toxorhynchites rutilus septentrionalis]XP_055618470.1 protein VAC14 homolog [Toxorhynchites rutilus septentrionalis]